MAGPGVKEVGVVGIRVRPDLRGFRTELEARLKAMRGLQVTVDVVPNTKGFLARLAGLRAAVGRPLDVPLRYKKPKDLAKVKKELSFGADVDLSAFNDFEKVLLRATIAGARLKTRLDEIRSRFDPIVRSATRARDAISGMNSSLGRSLNPLRQIESGYMRAATATGDLIRRTRSLTFDDFAESVRRTRDFLNGTDLGGFARLTGDAAKHAAQYRINMAGAWRHVGSIRDAMRGVRQWRTDSSGIAQNFRRVRDAARAVSTEIAVGWDFSKSIGAQDDGIYDPHFRAVERLKTAVQTIRGQWRNVGETAKGVGRELSLMGRDLVRLPGPVQELAVGMGRLNNRVRYAKTGLGLWASLASQSLPKMQRDLAFVARRTVEAGQGLRDIPSRLKAAVTDTDRWARAFVTVGDNVMDVDRTLIRAYKRIGQGFSQGFNAVRTSGALAAQSVGRSFDNAGRSTTRYIRNQAGIVRGHRQIGRSSSLLGKTLVLPFKALGGAIGLAGKALAAPIKGFSQLGDTGKLVVVVLALLPGILGLIAGLLAGLPALILAFGAAIGVVALGLDGIKNAASVLQPQFQQLQATASAAFESGLRPVFENLKVLMPIVDAGVKSIAQGMVSWAAGIQQVLTSNAGMQMLKTTLDGIGHFFTDVSPFISESVRGFMIWGSEGAKHLGLLSGLLNKFGSDWSAMAQRVVDNGSFQKALEGLTQVVQTLMGIWLELLEYGIDAMGRFAGPISTLFQGLMDILMAIMPVLEVVFVFIAQAIGAIAPLFEAITPAITQLGQSLSTYLVDAFTALAPFIEQVAVFLGQFAMVLVEAITPILPIIVDLLTQVAQVLGASLGPIFEALMPLIELLAKFFMDLFIAVSPLIQPLMDLATVVLQAIVDLLTHLLPMLMPIIEMILPMIIDLVKMLVPALVQIIDAIIPIIPVIVDFAKVLMDDLGETMQIVRNIIEDVWPWIRTIISGVIDVIAGLIKFVCAVIQGDWGAAWDAVKQILRGAVDIVTGLIGGLLTLIISTCVNIYNGVKDAFVGAGQWLMEAGKAIFQGLWDGMKRLWESVKGWITGIGDWIVQNKGPVRKDRRLLIPAGRAIMAGLSEGLHKGFTPVQKQVGAMAGQLASSFQAQRIGEDWVSGITDSAPLALKAVEDVVSAMQTSGQITTDWKSHIESDDFGGIAEKVAEALSQWGINLDSNGLMKLVNKANTRKARRR